MNFFKIVIVLFSGLANAGPFYFQTTLGSAGSFGRGLGHETGGIALGVTLAETGRFGLDIETGYSHIGSVKGKTKTETIVWYEPIEPEPVIVEAPVVVEAPVIQEPQTVTPDPRQIIVAPEPIKPPLNLPVVTVPSPEGEIKTPILVTPLPQPDPKPEQEEIPILVLEVPPNIFLPPRAQPRAIKGIPDGVRINGQELKSYFPQFSTDLYSLTAGARLKLGNFMWIQVRGGAEKKVIDGQIEEKTEKGEMINWRTKEKFRDDEWTYILGGSALFNLRKQLMGVVKIDYHDLNNHIDDNDFKTDDIIVSAGLRFGF